MYPVASLGIQRPTLVSDKACRLGAARHWWIRDWNIADIKLCSGKILRKPTKITQWWSNRVAKFNNSWFEKTEWLRSRLLPAKLIDDRQKFNDQYCNYPEVNHLIGLWPRFLVYHIKICQENRFQGICPNIHTHNPRINRASWELQGWWLSWTTLYW